MPRPCDSLRSRRRAQPRKPSATEVAATPELTLVAIGMSIRAAVRSEETCTRQDSPSGACTACDTIMPGGTTRSGTLDHGASAALPRVVLLALSTFHPQHGVTDIIFRWMDTVCLAVSSFTETLIQGPHRRC